MSSDGKPTETSHDTLDDAFFSRDAGAGAPHARANVMPDDMPVTTQPAGAPVPVTSDDELHQIPDLAPDFDEDAVLGRKRGLHFGAFVLVLAGAIFGGLAGFYALRHAMPKPAPASTASASASAKVVAAPTNSASAPVAVAAVQPSAKMGKASTGARVSKDGTSGSSGTNPGAPSGPSDPALARGELSSGEISGVVERNRPLLKRRCWQPEVSARQGMGGSARVNTSFTIGPSGAVQSASASGGESDYPGLSSCIAARIREWKFPPSSGSTPVNVPFVFAAQ
jgi:hypothetical protein